VNEHMAQRALSRGLCLAGFVSRAFCPSLSHKTRHHRIEAILHQFLQPISEDYCPIHSILHSSGCFARLCATGALSPAQPSATSSNERSLEARQPHPDIHSIAAKPVLACTAPAHNILDLCFFSWISLFVPPRVFVNAKVLRLVERAPCLK